MNFNFTKIRKFTGWVLIIISVVLSIIGIVVAAMGEILKGGGIYVASQVTWYPGLALLGPEMIQKSKDIWNNLKEKFRSFFK